MRKHCYSFNGIIQDYLNKIASRPVLCVMLYGALVENNMTMKYVVIHNRK